jgi:Cu/Ag efflux protein CusF
MALAMLRYALILIPLSFACQSSAAPAETYRVRAQVVGLEGTGEAQRVILEHEAIDNFKDREGKADRMPAMKMAFGVAPSVDAAGLTPGSKHDITFDAVWGREPMIRVTSAKRLPDDTALELGEHD